MQKAKAYEKTKADKTYEQNMGVQSKCMKYRVP